MGVTDLGRRCVVSASKRKGTAAETAVVRWLVEHGFPHAERRAMSGTQDRGDIAGIPGVALEVKNCREMRLGPWMDEATREASNARARIFAVIHKRRGKTDPGQWFVTMPLEVFAELTRDV